MSYCLTINTRRGSVDLTLEICYSLCWMFETECFVMIWTDVSNTCHLLFCQAHPNENGIWVLTSLRTSWTKSSVIPAWTNCCIPSTPLTKLLKWSRSSRSTTRLARTVRILRGHLLMLEWSDWTRSFFSSRAIVASRSHPVSHGLWKRSGRSSQIWSVWQHGPVLVSLLHQLESQHLLDRSSDHRQERCRYVQTSLAIRLPLHRARLSWRRQLGWADHNARTNALFQDLVQRGYSGHQRVSI